MADSLPAAVLRTLSADLQQIKDAEKFAFRRKRLDFYLDSGLGSCILADPRAAEKVQEALLYFDGDRYRLAAWTVMPNHVHVLIEILGNATMAHIVQSWKSFTGRWIRANFELPEETDATAARRVWQREYWDRYIRDEDHFWRVADYIHQNPVKAKLVADARDWRWSSAYSKR